MAMKLKKEPISVETLQDYLERSSDFSFELRILEMLSGKGIRCEHGGQYKDPDTGKFREFDLRTRVTKGPVTLAAAIECKSIGHHFPLLVSCVKRTEDEAYHEILVHRREPEEDPGPFNFRIPEPRILKGLEGIKGLKVSPSTLYPVGLPVGKSTAQVGIRDTNNAEIHANDAEFFEKWTQALQSLDDLFNEVSDKEILESKGDGEAHAALILPIVVVPDGTLWTVNYSNTGRQEAPPVQSDRASIYIQRSYWRAIPSTSIEVTHLEVMTETGLSDFCDEYLSDAQSIMRLIGHE